MNNKEIKSKELEFNTYCKFTEKNQNINETIEIIFKDYIEKLKITTKK